MQPIATYHCKKCDSEVKDHDVVWTDPTTPVHVVSDIHFNGPIPVATSALFVTEQHGLKRTLWIPSNAR